MKIFTEAADVLQAVDKTHPPASKRDTATPSFVIIHISRPHKVWLPDEQQVRRVSMAVHAAVRATVFTEPCLFGF